MVEDQAIVRAVDLTRTYTIGGRELLALNGVTFSIPRRQFVAITGPSGSGKSTLLNILGCIDRATSGEYFVDGEEISARSDEALSRTRNQRIGFVFQSFHLLPRLTALQNVLLPVRFAHSRSVGTATSHARDLLARMGLSRHADHRPGELSGGQMQRVAIARALIMSPDILLADEPTGNLDSKSAHEVIELLQRINADGQSIILVTHDASVAARADRIIALRDGEIENDALA